MFEVAIRRGLDDGMRDGLLCEDLFEDVGRGRLDARWPLALGCGGLGLDPLSIGRNSRPRSGSGRYPRVATLGYQNSRLHR